MAKKPRRQLQSNTGEKPSAEVGVTEKAPDTAKRIRRLASLGNKIVLPVAGALLVMCWSKLWPNYEKKVTTFREHQKASSLRFDQSAGEAPRLESIQNLNDQIKTALASKNTTRLNELRADRKLQGSEQDEFQRIAHGAKVAQQELAAAKDEDIVFKIGEFEFKMRPERAPLFVFAVEWVLLALIATINLRTCRELAKAFPPGSSCPALDFTDDVHWWQGPCNTKRVDATVATSLGWNNEGSTRPILLWLFWCGLAAIAFWTFGLWLVVHFFVSPAKSMNDALVGVLTAACFGGLICGLIRRAGGYDSTSSAFSIWSRNENTL